MFEKLRPFAIQHVMGFPVYVWAIAVILGAANEIVNRAKWTSAQSILQGFGVVLAKLGLNKIPVIGLLVAAMSPPQPAGEAQMIAPKPRAKRSDAKSKEPKGG